MQFISINKFKDVIEEFYLDLDKIEHIRELVGALNVREGDTYLLRNHTYALSEHIFIPVRYSLTNIPPYVIALEKHFAGDWNIPRIVYRCINCGMYGVESYKNITTILPLDKLITFKSIQEFKNNLHTLTSKIYCVQGIKKDVSRSVLRYSYTQELIQTDPKKIYSLAFRIYRDSQLIFLDRESNRIRKIQFTPAELFDTETPFMLRKATGEPMNVQVIANAVTAKSMKKFMRK